MKPWLKYLFLGICAWYILLTLGHFLCQRPLWNDEVCVLNNITQLSPRDLFNRGLVSDQAFPRLYLLVIQQFSNTFEHQPWSLRFFPLICMLGAFVVWIRIAVITWASNVDRLNFVLCWASSIPLIYYAAELKQYSMDVLAGGLLVLLLLKISKEKLSSWWLCAFPLLGLLSYPVFFLMLIPIYVLLPKKNVLGVYILVCALMVVYVWLIDLRHSPAHLLETYWHDYFISFASLSEFLKSLGEGINNLISRWFVETPKIYRAIARVFVGIGLAYMVWEGVRGLKKTSVINVPMIAFMVLLELVLLGALRKFPFTVPRMSLFFAPMLLFCLTDAMSLLRKRYPRIYWLLQVTLWAYLSVMSIGIAMVIIHGNLGAQSVIF